ncbi:MAG: aminotransferase class III-fold pyridoxal phosphate-dependent enzyme, partial [Desulfurococcaceae archaeon]
EVQMALGRTGKMFAIEHFNVVPEVITMAKALGGGVIPIGATIFKKDLDFKKPGRHSNTFGGHALACMVALKTIEVTEKILPNVQKLEPLFKEYLYSWRDKYEFIGDTRGLGLAWAIEIVKNKKSKEPDVDKRNKIINNAIKKGLVLLPCGKNSIRIIPPIVITYEEAETGLRILEEAIKSTI